MMAGTSMAIHPIMGYLSHRSMRASKQDFPVRLPMASSVISMTTPNVTTSMRYTSRKIPPPYCSARYGKRQRFPRPTAAPAVARRNPSLPENPPRFSTVSIDG